MMPASLLLTLLVLFVFIGIPTCLCFPHDEED